MNQTANLHLPQFAASDRIHHDDFNDAFSKIDTAIANGVKIATGSYVGTGVYGSSHKNSLTFPFTPKLLLIFSDAYTRLFATPATTVANAGDPGETVMLQWNGTSVSWYTNENSGVQLNTGGKTYHYAVFG